MSAESPLLDPEMLARIERLALRFGWRTGARGSSPGRGLGRRLGSAGEFEGYRRYESGDDLRSLDPKVFVRLRRPMVKVLREDSAVPVTLLVDASASMTGAMRRECVAALTCFFLLLAHRRGDPVRIFTFTGGRSSPVAVRSPRGWVEHLFQSVCDGSNNFRRAFQGVPPHPAGRGILLVVSDAMGIVDADRELAPLARQGRPFWFAPLEPEERNPTGDGERLLRSREQEPAWRGNLTPAIRRAYSAQVERFHDALRRRLLGWGGDFFALPAERSPEALIQRIHARRTLLR